MVARVWSAVAVVLVGCGGAYPQTQQTTTPDNKLRRGIEAAGLPYQILDARTGHQVDEAAFWAKLGGERIVCVGEEHPNPHHHWVQLEVAQHLAAQPHLALGMEMFQRPFQGVLDDYAAGRIDAAALRSRTGYADRWGYDWGFYAPTIAAIVAVKGTLLALNAPRELTKKISHHGLESLTGDEKAQVPDLDLQNAAHRAWFDALMEEMGGTSAHSAKDPNAPPPPQHAEEGSGSGSGEPAEHEMPTADRIYTVQVVWDETMADTAARWARANPQGHLVILAGNGHCHDSAIVGRIKRRGITDVVSLRTVIDDGEGGVAEALAKPMNDYLVVLQLPKQPKS